MNTASKSAQSNVNLSNPRTARKGTTMTTHPTRRTKLTRAYVLTIAILMVGLSANAATIANYTFAGSSLVSSDSDPDSNASAISDGGGLNAVFETRSFGVRGNPIPSLRWTNGDMNDGTVLDTDYLAFSITAISGNLTFGSLSFDFSGGTTEDIYLFSSQNGFDNIGDAIQLVEVIAPDPNFNTYTVPLASMTMATASSTTEFRLYFDSSASFGAGEKWIDNIQLSSVPVPEPTTFALMGLLGLCAVRRRRR